MGVRHPVVVGCLLGVLLLVEGGARGADAPQSVEIHELKIGRQPLDSALQQLARQCGLQIIFFSSVTQGLAAPALHGSYTVDSAMDKLLAGSGLSFHVINAQTIEVRPQRMQPPRRPGGEAARDSVTRSERRPGGEQHTDPLQEVVVVGVAEQVVATRIATPLKEIPQSVSIVTREQSRLQNDFDLSDVLEHSPGISTVRSGSIDHDFLARGYWLSSYHIDGGAAVIANLDSTVPFRSMPDLSEFDHVEVLRGADALFGGNANPGATVSLVRKRPQHHFAVETSATVGSWGNRRFEVDFTGPLALDGALRGRAVAAYAQNGFFYDLDATDRRKIFGVLDYDITPRATITAGGSYEWEKGATLDIGLPLYQNGRDSRLPRDTSLALDWNRYDARLAEAYLQYRQSFGESWAVKVNTAGWRSDVDFGIGTFTGSIRPSDDGLDPPGAIFTIRPTRFSQATADVTFTGTARWFGLREEIAIGGDFTRAVMDSHTVSYFQAGPGLSSVEAFNPADYPDPRATSEMQVESSGLQSLNQYGAFVSVRTYLNDDWSVTTGARLNFNETALIGRAELFGVPLKLSFRFKVRPIVTPFLGVMYDLNDQYSLYASYAEIYEGQGVQESRPGHKMRATRGINQEVGIKAAWRGGALNGSLVLYRVGQRDLPSIEGFGGDLGAGIGCCYTTTSTRSRGADLELSGELARGWLIGAGYTYNENHARESGTLSSETPKHLFKAWTNARLPGELNRWTIGGSLHAQSRNFRRNDICNGMTGVCGPVDSVQRGYGVFDLRAGFDASDHWQIALKVDNVLDKIYYESLETGSFHAWYGEPRNWTLRADGRF